MHTIVNLLLLALPPMLLLGALPWRRRWATAVAINAGAFLTALGVGLAQLLAVFLNASPMPADFRVLGTSGTSLVVTILVTFLGYVIVRYSRNHLRGEAGRDSYLTQLQFTLAAVVVVVLSDHLLLFLAGWTAISLGLHRLLLFYPDRPRAVLAAHKKFLLARTAEVALLAAALLLYSEHGSWYISEIVAAYTAGEVEPGIAVSVATVLLAVVAIIKCAQLPVHGWLIQVVEAPTPVSALLHAGIINLGGFLLILFGPLLSVVPAAQWLLLIVAGLTTALAALVMTTQASIKVRLAWSTSAQMGLMLVECALGLYELALLHLLAHACYKAYGFLASGSAVEQAVERRLAPRQSKPLGAWLFALLVALPAGLLLWALIADGGPVSPWLLFAALTAFLLVERGTLSDAAPALSAAALIIVLTAGYLLQKFSVAPLIAHLPQFGPAGGDQWMALLIVSMCGAFWMLTERPQWAISRRLDGLLYVGFHLDEWFTRTTLRLWPLQLPARRRPKRPADRISEVY